MNGLSNGKDINMTLQYSIIDSKDLAELCRRALFAIEVEIKNEAMRVASIEADKWEKNIFRRLSWRNRTACFDHYYGKVYNKYKYTEIEKQILRVKTTCNFLDQEQTMIDSELLRKIKSIIKTFEENGNE